MNHRSIFKIIIPVVFVLTLISIIFALGKNSNHASAGNTPSYLYFENFNPKAELGTRENPFIILEIVPYRGMGQIGYIIDGQEPVEPTSSNIGIINGIANNAIIETNGTIKNTEIFKKRVLNLTEEECAEYFIRVVTITPDVLNANVEKFSKYYDLSSNGKNNKKFDQVTKGEIDLIGNADLISISTMAQGGNIPAIDLWNSSRRDKSESVSYTYNLDFKDNDISWQTAMELFMKVGVVNDSAAMVYDISVFQAPNYSSKTVVAKTGGGGRPGYCNNFYKLILMLRQSNPALFYEKYFNADTIASRITHNQAVDSGSYNAFFGDAAIYWNEYTFLPAYEDGTYPNEITEEYKKYLKSQGYLIQEISGQCSDSVIRNAYSYNGGTSIVQSFTSNREDIGLKEIVVPENDIRSSYNKELFDFLEDKEKETNPNASRPTIARPCEALEYLLSKKKEVYKESITILDLEPCNDFTLTEEMVRGMLPYFAGNIHIKRQTTAEFIGKTEDINQIYDLIYIGTNTGKMKTVGGETRYNDPMLDGYVYLHVGDRVVGHDIFKGSIKDASFRLGKAIDHIIFKNQSFNKANILKSLNNGYLLELLDSADFYRYSGNDITTLKRKALVEYLDAGYPILLENDLYTANASIVDDQSNLYQFLLTCKKTKYKEQVFNRKSYTKSKLMKAIQNEKLFIHVISTPVEYKSDDNSTLITDRKLPFRFTIHPLNNSGSDDLYNWGIAVDKNSDGIFSDSEYELKKSSTAGDISCSLELTEEYKGVIPWKLTVELSDNPNIRWSKTGCSAFKVPTMEESQKKKSQVDILQITSNDSTNNLQELMNPGPGKTSLFYKFTKDLDDFNISMTTVNVAQFEKMYKDGGTYDANKPETDQLKDYEMLIFGFGDCYSDIGNEYGALNNIRSFIKSGRSVIFSHDTTSFVNLPENEYKALGKKVPYWGYGMNQIIRSIAGMDRFNVLKQANNPAIYDKAVMPELVAEITGNNSVYQNLAQTSDDSLCYPETQGLTNGCLVAYSNPNEASDGIYNLNKEYPPFNTGNNITKGTGIENYYTTYVSKVNEGQITSYPYVIPDTIEVSETHLQPYQLNMDDPEITVWFCLSDSKKDGTGPYSTSPKDVRNNYYVYNRKNIIYTGVGHSKMDGIVNLGTKPPYSEYEVKLFINTLIAAYNACIVPPTVEITNKEAKFSNNGYLWYQYFQNPNSVASEFKAVKFKAYDSNLSSNDLVVRIYEVTVKDNSTSVDLIDPSSMGVYDSRNNHYVPVYNQTGQRGYVIKADTEYCFDYPMKSFSENGFAKLYITVTNKDNLTGDTTLRLLNRSLFNLD